MPVSWLDSTFYAALGADPMRRIMGDLGRFEAWVAFEVALAEAQADLGIVPVDAAREIAAEARADRLEVDALGADLQTVMLPVVPFVAALRRQLGPHSAPWLHYGTTTQDVMDTGTSVQLRRGLNHLEGQLRRVLKAAAQLAEEHRDTQMVGRTMQQRAAPITFGFKLAVWVDELLRHLERLAPLRARALVGQLGGSVGTGAALGAQVAELRAGVCRRLDLAVPEISWHVARDRLAETAAWLAGLTASLARLGREVGQLAASEIGEVQEPIVAGRGVSSTLPNKHNPTFAQLLVAAGARARAQASLALDAMVADHERGFGSWHLEWTLLPELCVVTSDALHHAEQLLDGLVVHRERMAAQLTAAGDVLMAESVMMGLASTLGRFEAHDVVHAAVEEATKWGTSLGEALGQHPRLAGTDALQDLPRWLDPARYLGEAGAAVDRVVRRAHDALSEPPSGSP